MAEIIVVSIREDIESRGHWVVLIRPTRLVEKRVPFETLQTILERAAVQIRGWDFPHIDYKTPIKKDIDWIGQDFEWDMYREIWRFFQSGQFAHLSALTLDWRDKSEIWKAPSDWKPGLLLGIGDATYHYKEALELAARLAVTDAGDSIMHIEVCPKNLEGRVLYLDDSRRWPLHRDYKASLNEFPQAVDIDREELLANPASIALGMARELFLRFGFDASTDTLDEISTH